MRLLKSHLSATHPQIGLNIPYRLEKSKNTSPVCSVDRPNCLKCGSNVGSRNAHVLDTTTITKPVMMMEGIVKSFSIDAVFDPDTYSENKQIFLWAYQLTNTIKLLIPVSLRSIFKMNSFMLASWLEKLGQTIEIKSKTIYFSIDASIFYTERNLST